jgi:hypothetical protein
MLVLSLRSMWSQFYLREAIAVSTSLHESDVAVFQRHRWKWLAYARRSRDVVFADETARWAQGYSISFEAPIGPAPSEHQCA